MRKAGGVFNLERTTIRISSLDILRADTDDEALSFSVALEVTIQTNYKKKYFN